MRILLVHNYYQQRGGEDQCFEDEVRVLQEHGVIVETHSVHNDSIEHKNKLSVALGTVWNREAARYIRSRIDAFQPDILHAMNTFPLLSPSVLRAAKKRGVAVVQEVQNYRFACANAFLLRNGTVCETCLHSHLPIAAVQHRCYRDNLAGSLTLASSIFIHKLLKTWNKNVDTFLTPSQTTRSKMVEFGIDPKRILIKPNTLNFDPGFQASNEDCFVFVGRLSPEKGLTTVLKAWQQNPCFPNLKVIGDGPEAGLAQAAAANDGRIEWLGKRPLTEVLDLVGKAKFLIMPSVWYEAFGRTTIEAFAKGTPVIGSRIGGTAEIITDEITGFLFEPNSSADLSQTIHKALTLTEDAVAQMRVAARHCFEENYTSRANLNGLLAAYDSALAHASKNHDQS
ncbi:glycosyltransferase [Pirellulaceae bacterium SH449]